MVGLAFKAWGLQKHRELQLPCFTQRQSGLSPPVPRTAGSPFEGLLGLTNGESSEQAPNLNNCPQRHCFASGSWMLDALICMVKIAVDAVKRE